MKVPTDRMVDVGGVSTRYWVEGAGSPVVLIHGLSNSIEHWLLNIHALAAEHTVYAVDLIGHGRTDRPIEPSTVMATSSHKGSYPNVPFCREVARSRRNLLTCRPR